MIASTKLYTVSVFWPGLKETHIENFTDRDRLLRYLGFFVEQKANVDITAFESDVHYFTTCESWHVMMPKQMDSSLLMELAIQQIEKPKPVALLTLKEGEEPQK